MSDEQEVTVVDDNTKTYEVKAVLMFLDDKGERKRLGCEVEFENPVDVLDEEGNLLGAATLNVDGKVLEAQMFIDYHTPTRLNIETKAKKLYVHMRGAAEVANGVDGPKQPRRYVRVNVWELVINADKPDDDRLESL
jgi:hypothetical protein